VIFVALVPQGIRTTIAVEITDGHDDPDRPGIQRVRVIDDKAAAGRTEPVAGVTGRMVEPHDVATAVAVEVDGWHAPSFVRPQISRGRTR
jgi:hypothetical protein